jgi:hypothetical protein
MRRKEDSEIERGKGIAGLDSRGDHGRRRRAIASRGRKEGRLSLFVFFSFQYWLTHSSRELFRRDTWPKVPLECDVWGKEKCNEHAKIIASRILLGSLHQHSHRLPKQPIHPSSFTMGLASKLAAAQAAQGQQGQGGGPPPSGPPPSYGGPPPPVPQRDQQSYGCVSG